MGGESGVVSTSMLRMKNQGNIQYPRFCFGVPAVRAQQIQDVLRRGQLWLRGVNEQALSVMIMAVCLIAVYRQTGEKGDQLKRLSQYIGDGNIVGIVIIGIQGQYASCQRVHHVIAGSLHDNVPDKAGRQGTVMCQKLFEVLQLLHGRQFAEQQQVSGLLITKVSLLDGPFYNFFNIVSSII